MNNFFSHSYANGCYKNNKFIDKKNIVFNNYKIQFNMINSAPFSTLSPDRCVVKLKFIVINTANKGHTQ